MSFTVENQRIFPPVSHRLGNQPRRLATENPPQMEFYFFLAMTVAASAGAYQIIRAFESFRNPKSRGDKKLKPSIPLQLPAHEVSRPRQGSSSNVYGAGSGYLYLISHANLQALKIGVSNNASQSDRVSDHVSQGWKVENIWTFNNFSSAERIEGAVIAWWRNELKLPPHVPQSAMPQGGYTETVSSARIGIPKTTAFVEKLIGQAEGKRAIEVPISQLIPGATMSVKATLKYVTRDSKTWTYYSRSRKGYLYRNHRQNSWQRWVLEDGSGRLLVELRAGHSVSIKSLKVGSRVLVVGRVEKADSIFRMTNPVFEVLTDGAKSRLPKKKISNESLLERKQVRSSSSGRAAPTSGPGSNPRSRSIAPQKTAKTQLDLKLNDRNPRTQLAERCSSCGALVPDGTSHDCR